MQMYLDRAKDFLHVFIPVFVAIDVFMLLPIFITFTEGLSTQGVRRVINQSLLTALLISLFFVILGDVIFRLIGITVDDFKIAGGLVLLVIAVREIVNASGTKNVDVEGKSVGVVPIGVPMIVGPALLTTLIMLLQQYGFLYTLFSLLLNLFIVWILFKKAIYVINVLGQNGVRAVSKLMAILLASIAVMMMRVGIENTFRIIQ
jgi:multiple antibiotic resistance protein